MTQIFSPLDLRSRDLFPGPSACTRALSVSSVKDPKIADLAVELSLTEAEVRSALVTFGAATVMGLDGTERVRLVHANRLR